LCSLRRRIMAPPLPLTSGVVRLPRSRCKTKTADTPPSSAQPTAGVRGVVHPGDITRRPRSSVEDKCPHRFRETHAPVGAADSRGVWGGRPPRKYRGTGKLSEAQRTWVGEEGFEPSQARVFPDSVLEYAGWGFHANRVTGTACFVSSGYVGARGVARRSVRQGPGRRPWMLLRR
jgi:hypothetical protein